MAASHWEYLHCVLDAEPHKDASRRYRSARPRPWHEHPRAPHLILSAAKRNGWGAAGDPAADRLQRAAIRRDAKVLAATLLAAAARELVP